MGLSFFLVKSFYLLMLWVVTSEAAIDNFVLAINDRADVVERNMDRAETVLATAQRDLAVVPATTRVANAYSIRHNNGTLPIDWQFVSV